MKKELSFIICLLLFSACSKVFSQSQTSDLPTFPKDFYHHFAMWDNNRFEAYINRKKIIMQKVTPATKNINYDSSGHQYSFLSNKSIDEIRRLGIVKYGKRLLRFFHNEQYDFHACFLLYGCFGSYTYGPNYLSFRHKTRAEWIASGQKEKDYNFWYDQFYGDEDGMITSGSMN